MNQITYLARFRRLYLVFPIAGCLGILLFVVNTMASSNGLSVEAGSGTLSNASSVNDASASSGKAVKFGNPGTTIWTGGFESGNLSGWIKQSCPDGVVVVTSPVREGAYAAKFTVTDQSTHANCPDIPTDTPRAQLISPQFFGDGDEYYIGFSTYFPTDFPTTPSWFQFAEIYGPPYGASPSMSFNVTQYGHLSFDRTATGVHDRPWVSPSLIDKGSWEDIVAHIKFSTDPSVGYVEIWLNGVKQTFIDGSTRIYYDTLVPGGNWDGHTKNSLFLNQYRDGGMTLGSVTIYHDAARIGTTYESAQP